MYRLPTDTILRVILRSAAAVAAGVILLIFGFLMFDSLPALRSVGFARFLTDPSWHPAGGAQVGRFDLTPMLVGTLTVTVGAMSLAAPLGIASALFCAFYAPPGAGVVYRKLIELLAGIPSVIYGFWGLVALAPLIREWQPPGQSLLAGVLILSIMILPTVALLSESTLRTVPRGYLQGAAALGLSRWATIRGVVFPAARSGIVIALLLATGRALGETMAVLMVTGNVARVPGSVFDPIRTLTANIALELGYALDQHRSALFVSGLLLTTITVVIVIATAWIGRRREYV